MGGVLPPEKTMTDETNGNGPLTIAELREQLNNQTGFRRDLLRFMNEGESYSGQEIKDKAEMVYPEINHGRLYPNLDTLVENGLITRGQRDRRTNSYEITSKGQRFIAFVNEELGR